MTDASGPSAPARVLLYASLAAYQLVYLIAFFGFLAWRMAFDRRYRSGIPERFGFVARSVGDRPVVWIHGVSVGEVKAAGSLIQRLREERPELELVISSTTPTGYALARDLHPDLRVILYPLDLAFSPWIALKRIRPRCVLLVELEVWPNFLQAAARQNVPVAVINGRISEQSFQRYHLVRALLPQFNLIQIYCMQDEVYRERLLDLNVHASRAFVTGNMKYDNVRLKESGEEFRELREWLSPDGRLVFVAGSTHGEEEVWLSTAAARVSARISQPVRTIVAPRHPERALGVRESLESAGIRCSMWSEHLESRRALAADELLIVDTIGHLESFYGACDVAFIGGSLVRRGGQNMVEAAALGKAVVFGPNVSNFRKDVQLLLEADAACQVHGLEDLDQGLVRLFTDSEVRQGLGRRAVALIQRNQGSTERTLEMLRPLLA